MQSFWQTEPTRRRLTPSIAAAGAFRAANRRFDRNYSEFHESDMSRSKRRLNLQSLETRRLLAAVEIPDNLVGAPAAVVSVPVNIDTAAGVRAAEIRLSYDTNLLDLTEAAVTAGTVWAGAADTQVTANVNDTAGTVVIFVSSSSDLTAISGSLVQLGFTIASNATLGNTTALNLTTVELNEGLIAVTPAPAAGVDPTDGLLTFTAAGPTDRITGIVFADTNGDSTAGSLEGIPGVVITMVSSSGTQTTATTGADGRFEFLNVAAGTYTLRQTQPIAYQAGGVNELTAVLVSGQALADQNFREGGLLPRFLYSRLRSASVQPVGSTPWTTQINQINVDATAGTVAPARVTASSATSTTQVASMLSVSESSERTANDSVQSNSSADGGSDNAAESTLRSNTAGEGEVAVTASTTPVFGGFAEDEDAVNQADRAELVDDVLASSRLW
jgi:hypothetical protein